MATVAEHTDLRRYTDTDSEYTKLKQPKTLGFDLSLELRYIHQHEEPVGERTAEEIKEERFIRNAETYIDEALHVGIAKFDPYRIQKDNGVVTLTADNYEGPVRELFNPENPQLKDAWPIYRKTAYHQQRAQIEYERFCELESSLNDAKIGDSYIWISPPPYDIIHAEVSDEAKKRILEEQGFGFHTNTFVFTVEDDHTLQGRVIQNYLRAEDQRELLKIVLNTDLFPDDIDELQILNTIAKIPTQSISASDIKSQIDWIYANTPEEQKIKPTQTYEQQLWTDEQTMKQIHYQMRPFLQYAFYLMRETSGTEILQDQDIQDFIAARFHIWEQTVADLQQGKAIGSAGIQNVLTLNSRALSELAHKEMQILRNQKRSFRPEVISANDDIQELNKLAALIRSQRDAPSLSTGCGIGSGFSTGENAMTIGPTPIAEVLPTNYIGAELLLAKKLGIEIRHENYKCPKCATEIKGEIIGSHPSTWAKKCPKDTCGYKFKCTKE